MRGILLPLMVICTSTVCGFPVRLRDTGIQTTFWINASKIAKRKGKKACVSFHLPRKSLSFPNLSSLHIKDSWYVMKPIMASNCGICPLAKEQMPLHSRNVPDIHTLKKRDMCYSTPASVRSMESMSLSSNLWQRNTAYLSKPIIFRARKMPKMHQLLLLLMRFFMMASISPMNR